FHLRCCTLRGACNAGPPILGPMTGSMSHPRSWLSPRPLADSVLGKYAEGEIRTPEGLAAYQISSLARWTELRYLSASPSSEVGNTFSRELSGRTSMARHRVRTPSPAGPVRRSRGCGDGPPRIDRSRGVPGGQRPRAPG